MHQSRSQSPSLRASSVTDVCRDDGGTLRHLLARAQAYARLNERIATDIPAELHGHCRVACIRDDTLVIVAESAAWASRARLHSAEWLHAVRKHWPASIRQLKFRVQTPPFGEAAEKVPRQLPATVCDHLARCAETQRDPQMADILRRLAAKRAGGD